MAAIYPSELVSVKADITIFNPFSSYREFEDGDPIAQGQLYFGLVGRDPRVEENRKRVYVIDSDGLATPIPQPVILSAGGVPQYNGNPVYLAVDGSYSFAVTKQGQVVEGELLPGEQVYYSKKIPAKNLLGYSGVIPEESITYSGFQTVTFNTIEASTASIYLSTVSDGSAFKGQYLKAGVDYKVVSESTITLLITPQNGDVILGRALDPTGQIVDVENATKPIYIYDTKAEAKAVNLPVGASVLINGGDTVGDGKGGSYLVVDGGTGVEDGYNYINMTSGRQLKIKSIYQVFSGYSEQVSNATLQSSRILIDPTDGNIAKYTLSSSVSGIDVVNIPASGELKIQLELKQDPVTPRTVAWLINGVTPKTAGGTLPTVTATADAVDVYIFSTNDAGNTWHLFTVAQDIK